MTYACQLTEIPKHDFPELIQFYRHFSHKYPFLLTTSANNFDNRRQAGHSDSEQVSVFDILFIEPEEWLKLNHQLKLSTSSKVDINPDDLFLDAFDRLFSAEKNNHKSASGLPVNLPFTGGWFVFLAYELAQQIEPRLNLTFDKQLLPVAYAARVKKALIYDHKKEKIFFLSESGMDHKQSVQSLLNDAQHLQKLNCSKSSFEKLNDSLQEENKNIFLKSVKTVKNYIKEGDVFQVNLSRLWQSSFDSVNHTEQAFSLSKILSKENPAPFSGLADFASEQGTASIISSSPERLLKVKDNCLESRPIAGTHPRSTSEEEDSRLLNELHEHPKEQAEHIMLIDLIRNDLGRVCVPGTVVVDELMVNESYAHVHHIVSNVSGQLQSDKTPGEVIKAMFPGGTITGCPKVRCMEIIAELEQKSRGAYTGSIGFINLDGSMDLNILIRTMVLETVLET
ncbi:MAG: chorismate-binding protein, partial [Gammaproteobacteria bacterium]|nr:chorismate-binding protein [Gammaproteobacteria bacterium]